jgi:NTP pyrophosphatase (non-canonical NTP hydrolase)
MSLDLLAERVHATAREKGFWAGDVDINFVLAKIALVHSEGSEILEAIRKEKGDAAVVEEMADLIIRLLDLYEGMRRTGWLNETVSLDHAIDAKARFNTTRPQRHGVLA